MTKENNVNTESLNRQQSEKEAFWIVWNPQGRNPTHRHGSEFSANNEAERLARLNPGQVFIVLRAVGARMVNDMQRVSFVEEAPF